MKAIFEYFKDEYIEKLDKILFEDSKSEITRNDDLGIVEVCYEFNTNNLPYIDSEIISAILFEDDNFLDETAYQMKDRIYDYALDELKKGEELGNVSCSGKDCKREIIYLFWHFEIIG